MIITLIQQKKHLKLFQRRETAPGVLENYMQCRMARQAKEKQGQAFSGSLWKGARVLRHGIEARGEKQGC
jgi:hypothetical protein